MEELAQIWCPYDGENMECNINRIEMTDKVDGCSEKRKLLYS